MEKLNAFQKLLVQEEVQEIIEKTQDLLFKEYRENKEEILNPKDVWGYNNVITLDMLPEFFGRLKRYNILDTHLVVHYTILNSEDSYEAMNSRVILFDMHKPIFVEGFDCLIDVEERSYERSYVGLLKEGFKDLIEAVLIYDKYEEITTKEM